MTEIFQSHQPDNHIQQVLSRSFSEAFGRQLVNFLTSAETLSPLTQIYTNGTTPENLEFLAQSGVDLTLLDYSLSPLHHQS